MNTKQKRKIKVKTKKLINSFKYASEGFLISFKRERNMKIHKFIMILVIILGNFLKINKNEWIICIILFTIFKIDNIISSNVVSSINVEGSKLIIDNTEEITDKVKKLLREKSWLHRRLINAYPNLKDIKVKIKNKIEKERHN